MVAGAIIGSAIPGVGTALGASIGGMIGGIAGTLIDPPKVKGPRLTDLKLQTSEYGRPVPIVYGRVRIAGNVIWQTDLQEHEQSSGGKGGGPEVTEYSYSASLAVMLCEGEINRIVKVWADGRVVWPGDESFKFTLYKGTEDQEPDPTMEADLGAGQVPAHRGYAYVVFTDLGLKDFGNRIPQLEFLVDTQTASGGVIVQLENKTDTEWQNKLAIDAWTTAWDASPVLPDPSSVSGPLSYDDTTPPGKGAVRFSVVGTYRYADASTTTLYYGYGANDPSGTVNGVLGLSGDAHWPDTGIQRDILDEAGITGRHFLGCVLSRDGTKLLVWTCDGASDVGGTAADKWHMIVDGDEVASGPVSGTHARPSLPKGNRNVFDSAYTSGMMEDNAEYVWQVTGNDTYGSPIAGDVRIWTFSGNTLSVNGSMGYGPPTVRDVTGPDAGYLRPSCFVTEDGYFGVIKYKATTLYTRVRSGGGVMLGDIVADLSRRTKSLDASEYDTSALTQMVPGFVVADQMPVVNAIRALQPAYFFDGVESGGTIVYSRRGGASIVTIPVDDLSARTSGNDAPARLSWVRIPQQELPRRVYAEYLDTDFDYQKQVQYAERAVGQSESDTTVTLPISLQANTALAIAGANLWSAHVEADRATWTTTRAYAQYEPTDVVTVSGWVIRIETKLERQDGTIEWSGVPSDAYALTESPSAVGGASSAKPQPLPRAATPTELVLLDIPVLSMRDAPFGFYAAMGPEEPGVKWPGAALFKSADDGETWSQVATTVMAATIGHAVGALADYSGDLDVDDTTATVDVILHNPSRSISSATAGAFAAGANLCALASGSTWELLQFKSATLVSTDGAGRKRYTLGGAMKRGRLGSSDAMATHAANDAFVLLPCLNVDAPESELNVALKYKAVTLGTALADADVVVFTNTGSSAGGLPGAGGIGPIDQGGGGYFGSVSANLPIGHRQIAVATYTLTDGDRAYLLSFKHASGVIVTLPSTLPNKWWAYIENIGAGDVTLDAGSAKIDGGASTLTIETDQGVVLVFDGADYWTMRGVGAVGIPAGGTTSQVLAKASATNYDVAWVTPSGGGGGGDCTLVASIVPTGAPISVSFTSIPASGKSLMVRFSCGDVSTGGSGDYPLNMMCNGDNTSGNYDTSQYVYGTGISAGGGTHSPTGDGVVVGHVAGAVSLADAISGGTIQIYDYVGTDMYKLITSDTYRMYSSSSRAKVQFGAVWKSKSAITSLTFKTDGSGFRAGSRFDLYMFM